MAGQPVLGRCLRWFSHSTLPAISLVPVEERPRRSRTLHARQRGRREPKQVALRVEVLRQVVGKPQVGCLPALYLSSQRAQVPREGRLKQRAERFLFPKTEVLRDACLKRRSPTEFVLFQEVVEDGPPHCHGLDADSLSQVVEERCRGLL